jgi:hypothetical protein
LAVNSWLVVVGKVPVWGNVPGLVVVVVGGGAVVVVVVGGGAPDVEWASGKPRRAAVDCPEPPLPTTNQTPTTISTRTIDEATSRRRKT